MQLVTDEQIAYNSEKGYWGKETSLDLLFKNAAEFPDAEALIDPYNRSALVGDQPKRYTYKQLLTAIDRLAIRMIELEIQKDDVIAVQLPNIVELIVTYFAAARIGAIVTPLGMLYRTHEVEHSLKQCNYSLYVTTTTFNKFCYTDMIKDIMSKHPQMKTVIAVGPEEEIPSFALSFEKILNTPLETDHPADFLQGKQSGPNEVFTICWTSGTEADPKGVPRSHNHWITIGIMNIMFCILPPKCTVLASFPLINMAGIGAALMTWIVNGGKLVLHHPFDPATYLRQIPGEKVYYTMAPPALLVMLDQMPDWANLDKSSLKVVATGGSPLPHWIVKKYREAYNIDIVNEFASNEGLGIITSTLFFDDPEDRAVYFPRIGAEEIEWKNFDQISNATWRRIARDAIRIKIVHPETRKPITENGIPGELCYRGPSIFAGYWNRPDLTARAFDSEGFYSSGDLFSLEGEKQDKFLFKGRFKDLIIRGGQNISPEEIENLVGSHPKVAEVAAIGCPDKRLGEKICVCVVPKPGQTVSLDEINTFLKPKDIAVYKHPERLEIIEKMPRNALNKIEKKTLRRMFGFESSGN
jgi:acyl-CoA synthetase (AMP-forming)/AMP-acid ligase II